MKMIFYSVKKILSLIKTHQNKYFQVFHFFINNLKKTVIL
ncbi:hypothetical protein FLJC2902T_13630 [Flavobacterium limnosediminis JC2902]|uniref:Uncharacterized protein n=1 Tax=Flavobacterium limnosediminis JC2902 TaxID=1341181 RepID=V6SRF9_9FLAO|nr:hypothetical protein FLJC2902T_13630 [Flavobacterium limnosediminis JC2902]